MSFEVDFYENLGNEREVERENAKTKILEMYVTDLDICFSACKILILNEIETVKDIVSYTEEELLALLQKKDYVEEIKCKIDNLGVHLVEPKKNIEEMTIVDLGLMISSHPSARYALSRQFNTIEDITNIETFYYSGGHLPVIKRAFLVMLELGFEFKYLNIKTKDDVNAFFNNCKRCKNCDTYYHAEDNTEFCPRCNPVNSLADVDDNCFIYYSYEKNAIMIKNSSNRIIDFDIEIEDAYLTVNNREENLVEDDCIFEFQSGILPNSERALIDLSKYKHSVIDTIVIVLGNFYYEFKRKNGTLLLHRVIDSKNGAEKKCQS